MGSLVRSRLKVDLAALLRELVLNERHFYGYPFSLETVFEVYRWFVAGGARFAARHHEDAWAVPITMAEAVLGGVMHGNAPHPQSALWSVYGHRDEHTWIEDLRYRLVRLLMAPCFEPLRAEMGIAPLGPKIISFPREEHSFATTDLEAFFALGRARRWLNYPPNSVHLDARLVTNTGLCPAPDGWQSVVVYSCPDGGSVWRDDNSAVKQKRGEPFSWFVRRAVAALESALLPPFRPCAPADPRPWGRVRSTVSHGYGHMGIGASCWGEVHGPEADDSKRNTVEEMTAAAVALDRVADGGDRDAALAALSVLDNRITDSGTVAHHQAAALSGAKPPTVETLRRFASEWRDMASRAVVTPTYSTPGRSLIAMYPSAPKDRR